MQIIRFEPIYKERVWGGRSFEKTLQRNLPPGQVIGESWDLVDREEAQSIVRGGTFDGYTIRQLIASHSEEIMGPKWQSDKRFPILVKWLDCQQKLSLQVHPPAPIAPTLGGEPKTENWYIAQAQPNAGLLVGLKRGVTREMFEKSLRDNKLEGCVHRIPSQAGDSILVESGRIHAIDAGNLILEIQQNSDTTYRVYDWGRVGLDGKPRDLHIDESLKSIDFDDFEPSSLTSSPEPGCSVLADCAEFRIRKENWASGAMQTISPGGKEPEIFHVISGSLEDQLSGYVLQTGDTILLPAAGTALFLAKSDCSFLRTDNFVQK